MALTLFRAPREYRDRSQLGFRHAPGFRRLALALPATVAASRVHSPL